MVDPYLAIVRLLSDQYRDEGVSAGAIGVVVEYWGDGFYEVEFSNESNGETIALLTLPASDVDIVKALDISRRPPIDD
jgi:hypothetical protein